MSTTERVRDYIQRELSRGREVSADDSLLELGILDSLAIVKLVTFIEDDFDIEIPDSDFDPECFETVSAIAELIDKVRA